MEIKKINWFDDNFYKIRYENDGVEVEEYIPSVTTKLGALDKPFLRQWYGDLGTREARLRVEEKADRGSRIHWAWHTFVTGGVVIYNPPKVELHTEEELVKIKDHYNKNYFTLYSQDEMYQMMKMEQFFKTLNPNIVESESIVYDIVNKDAGTADNILDIETGEYLINGAKPVCLEEGRYILDLKTGNEVGKEAKMQISAYARCYESMQEKKIKGALIVHTSARTKKGIEGLATIHLKTKDIEENYGDYRDIARVWDRNFSSRKPKIRQIPGIIAIKTN